MNSTAFHAPSAGAPGTSPVEMRLGCALPRPLAETSSTLSWDEFIAQYAPSGPIRLGRLAQGAERSEFQTTLSVADRIHTHRAYAHGPIAALTSALHRIGISIEVLSFHQRPVRGGVATFLRFETDGRVDWAFASGDSGDDSAARVMIAAANRVVQRAG
jgi:hypothetical protein